MHQHDSQGAVSGQHTCWHVAKSRRLVTMAPLSVDNLGIASPDLVRKPPLGPGGLKSAPGHADQRTPACATDQHVLRHGFTSCAPTPLAAGGTPQAAKILNGQLQVLAQVPNCVPGDWTADARQLFRWDRQSGLTARFEPFTGATVGEAALLSAFADQAVLSGDRLAVMHVGSGETSLVDMTPPGQTPPRRATRNRSAPRTAWARRLCRTDSSTPDRSPTPSSCRLHRLRPRTPAMASRSRLCPTIPGPPCGRRCHDRQPRSACPSRRL